jgi:hypothetical protein
MTSLSPCSSTTSHLPAVVPSVPAAPSCTHVSVAALFGSVCLKALVLDRMSSIYSNLAAHIDGYVGHARISTLMFLRGKDGCTPDAEFKIATMLEKECKEQKYTILYSKLMHDYSGDAVISALFEKSWPMDRDSENRRDYSSLEQQLTEKRNQALREEVCLDVPRFLSIIIVFASHFHAGANVPGARHRVSSHQGRP